jgi:hypothetical protein
VKGKSGELSFIMLGDLSLIPASRQYNIIKIFVANPWGADIVRSDECKED